MPARVWLSIGSNIDRQANINNCIRALRELYGDLILSRVYENESYGFEGSPFYNLVIGFDTEFPVDHLVTSFRKIEAENGRVRNGPKFAPRSLDIDLLLYGDLIQDQGEGKLQLPREEVLEYAFVLGPLAEVAGNELHPVLKISFAELWSKFDQDKHRLVPVDMPEIY